MRNLNSNKETTHNPNSQISRLEAIHRLINGRNFQPELVEEKLSKIKPSYLTDYCKVYFQYLNVRHHFNCYKQENIIEHLELAKGLLDEMDRTARKFGIKVPNDEYHFTRAYVRFVLTTLSADDYETPFIIEKVRFITATALGFNPNNSKFVWLQKQLAA